jgi:4-hydroxybenzoate polyprenyltransferase
LKSFIKLIRAHQWIKNSFIFLPIFFAVKMENVDLLVRTALVAIGFSLVASAIYIFNDWRDIEEDRQHPEKKKRPLASGAIKVPVALTLMNALAIGGSVLIFVVQPEAFYFTMVYVAMNLAYSLYLKRVALLDITIIAIGFVLRLKVGATVGGADTELSMWAILITFLLALFLALAKRRDDVVLAQAGTQVRKSIKGYNLEFINGAMMIMASVTVVAYISYTISDEVTSRFENKNLYLTVFWVILGILRYMQITFVLGKSGSPTKVLLRDVFLQVILVGWIATFVYLLYLHP